MDMDLAVIVLAVVCVIICIAALAFGAFFVAGITVICTFLLLYKLTDDWN